MNRGGVADSFVEAVDETLRFLPPKNDLFHHRFGVMQSQGVTTVMITDKHFQSIFHIHPVSTITN
jgi:hypothetical protein